MLKNSESPRGVRSELGLCIGLVGVVVVGTEVGDDRSVDVVEITIDEEDAEKDNAKFANDSLRDNGEGCGDAALGTAQFIVPVKLDRRRVCRAGEIIFQK
jgi:hypothetical protein